MFYAETMGRRSLTPGMYFRLLLVGGETIERSFAHLYNTGRMRRTHLRGRTNILKRLLIHAGGFNLGLVMRELIGYRTPRGLLGRVAAVIALFLALIGAVYRRSAAIVQLYRRIAAPYGSLGSSAMLIVGSSTTATYTSGW